VIDISDPLHPSIAGSCDTPSSVTDVYVSGDYAYVADWSSGLQVIDISDPLHPSIAGSCDTPGYAEGVYVSGDYAYVTDLSSGLQVIDISDPLHPSIAGSRDTPGAAYGIYVEGDYAYVTDGGSGLQVIDIRDYKGREYFLNNVKFINSTTLTATVPPKCEPDTYHVKVTNPTGEYGVLPLGFLVESGLPVIDSISFDECISELGTSAIHVNAHDPQGGALTYTYEPLDGGSIIGSGADVEFDPPTISPGYPCPYRVKVTVTSDKTGLSASQTIGIYVQIAGDINGDGKVNATDKLLLRNKLGWSGNPGSVPEDINCDGNVNATDKLILRQKLGLSWGCVCP
jgi:hypothetical protein